MKQQKDNQDEGLKGNEKIEEAIQALQQESTQEQLAHTLTVIRRRMRENGQLIVAVEPSIGQEITGGSDIGWKDLVVRFYQF